MGTSGAQRQLFYARGCLRRTQSKILTSCSQLVGDNEAWWSLHNRLSSHVTIHRQLIFLYALAIMPKKKRWLPKAFCWIAGGYRVIILIGIKWDESSWHTSWIHLFFLQFLTARYTGLSWCFDDWRFFSTFINHFILALDQGTVRHGHPLI